MQAIHLKTDDYILKDELDPERFLIKLLEIRDVIIKEEQISKYTMGSMIEELFKTDAKELFDWSLEQLVVEGWQIQRLSFDLHESNLSKNYKIMTTYERRFVNEGLKINFVKALPPKK